MPTTIPKLRRRRVAISSRPIMPKKRKDPLSQAVASSGLPQCQSSSPSVPVEGNSSTTTSGTKVTIAPTPTISQVLPNIQLTHPSEPLQSSSLTSLQPSNTTTHLAGTASSSTTIQSSSTLVASIAPYTLDFSKYIDTLFDNYAVPHILDSMPNIHSIHIHYYRSIVHDLADQELTRPFTVESLFQSLMNIFAYLGLLPSP